MRRFGSLLLGAALGLSSTSAHAQQAPAPASAAPAAAQPPEEPPYDPAAHSGIPEGAWLHMTRGTGRRSTGMMATGIVFVGLGAAFMGTGTGIYAANPGCNNLAVPLDPGPGGGGGFVEQPCSRAGAHAGGMAMLVAGAIGVALGIPLWVVGASDVPWAEAGIRSPATPRPRWAAAAPSLTGAPGGAGLVFHF